MTSWIIKQHLEAAHQMVSDLCHRKREWIMSIPARPDYDPDLIIGQALRDADRLLECLTESNSLLRSALSIAERDGLETNWNAFRVQLKNALERQHEIMSGYYIDKADQASARVQAD